MYVLVFSESAWYHFVYCDESLFSALSKFRMAQQASTAWIMNLNERRRRYIVRTVCARLLDQYGLLRHANPIDPLDDLIFIILSNRTRIPVAVRGFKTLKSEFQNWGQALVRPNDLERLLRPMGLALKKSRQILELLTQIQSEFGDCNLEPIRKFNEPNAEAYLTSLPGVSLKVAKCVMMYTLSFQVLPVDSNVHRIATRLGWVSRKRADQCHKDLEKLVSPSLRFGFHVDAIAHANVLCRARSPVCTRCPIATYCQYYALSKGAN